MKILIDVEFRDDTDKIDIRKIIKIFEDICNEFVTSGDVGERSTSMGWKACSIDWE